MSSPRNDRRLTRARPSGPPEGSHLPALMADRDFLDAYEVAAKRGDQPIAETYTAILGHIPAWFRFLFWLRNRIVAPFGIAAPSEEARAMRPAPRRDYAVGDAIGGWRIARLDPDEIITGFDDRHLDFRVSVMRHGGPDAPRVTLTTAVTTHNLFGRLYLATILPFHRLGVSRLLTNAARAGRL